MIPADFDYYRPDTLKEAAAVYADLKRQGRVPLYYAGGSEIISMSRVGSITPNAVVDLKAIPECSYMGFSEDKLVIGGAVTLSRIGEAGLFPLLKTTGGRIADHTNQCRITLGGNLCGTIIYRETSLPLLLCDAEIVLYGPKGYRRAPMREVFDQRMRLGEGEFVVQAAVDKNDLALPYVHVKKTRSEKIDYPLLTVAAVKKDGRIRAAFSGLCGFPFRSPEIEETLNDASVTKEARVGKAARQFPERPLNNLTASAEYRNFVFRKTVLKMLERLESV